MADEQLLLIFLDTDPNNDSKVTLNEFIEGSMNHLKDGTPESVIADAFREFDADGNNYLNFEEFKKMAYSKVLHDYGDHDKENFGNTEHEREIPRRKRIEKDEECESKDKLKG